MYVHAACDHTFFAVESDLTVLAFFGASLRVPWIKHLSPAHTARGSSVNQKPGAAAP